MKNKMKYQKGKFTKLKHIIKKEGTGKLQSCINDRKKIRYLKCPEKRKSDKVKKFLQ